MEWGNEEGSKAKEGDIFALASCTAAWRGVSPRVVCMSTFAPSINSSCTA